jgi:hypothetical protein
LALPGLDLVRQRTHLLQLPHRQGSVKLLLHSASRHSRLRPLGSHRSLHRRSGSRINLHQPLVKPASPRPPLGSRPSQHRHLGSRLLSAKLARVSPPQLLGNLRNPRPASVKHHRPMPRLLVGLQLRLPDLASLLRRRRQDLDNLPLGPLQPRRSDRRARQQTRSVLNLREISRKMIAWRRPRPRPRVPSPGRIRSRFLQANLRNPGSQPLQRHRRHRQQQPSPSSTPRRRLIP